MESVERSDYWTKAYPKGQTWLRLVQPNGRIDFGEGQEEREGEE
jgi:hypothetical protein